MLSPSYDFFNVRLEFFMMASPIPVSLDCANATAATALFLPDMWHFIASLEDVSAATHRHHNSQTNAYLQNLNSFGNDGLPVEDMIACFIRYYNVLSTGLSIPTPVALLHTIALSASSALVGRVLPVYLGAKSHFVFGVQSGAISKSMLRGS